MEDRSPYGARKAPQDVLEALLVQPQEAAGSRTVVVTSRPEWWNGRDVAVLEVGLGRGDGLRFDSEMERRVYSDLLHAGWARGFIKTGYAPDVRSPRRADFALLDGEGTLVAVIEVGGGIGKHGSVEQLAAIGAPSASKYLVANEGVYQLREDSRLTPAALPTPADFGLVPTGLSSQIVPLDVLLEGAAEDYLPPGDISVVLDPSLPVGIRDWRTKHTLDVGVAIASRLALLERVRSISLVAPASLLYRAGAGGTRGELLAHRGLHAVVQFDPGAIPGTSVVACLVVLGENRDATFFATASPDSRDAAMPTWLDALGTWLRDATPAPLVLASPKEGEAWTLGANDPAIRDLPKQLARFARVARLSELAEVSMREAEPNVSDGELQRLSTRDVVPPRFSVLEDPKLVSPGRDLVVQPGDVVVVLVGTALRAAVYEGDGPAVASNGLARVRLITDEVEPGYLVDYLNSSVAERYLTAFQTGVTIQRVPPRVLMDLPVPLVPPNVVATLGESLRAVDDLQDALDALQAARRSLFAAESEDQFREAVQALRERTSSQSASLELADDLSFRIRNFYPYPVAYGYRVTSAAASDMDVLREQLRFAENVLAFLAAVSLSLVETPDRPQLQVDLLRAWQGGVSPGTWREILIKANAVLANYTGSPLAQSIVNLKPQTDRRGTFGGAAHKLIARLNDWKHNRIESDEATIRELVEDNQSELEHMVAALGFLCDYPLCRVDQTDTSRDGTSVTVVSTLLRGDHPALARELVEIGVSQVGAAPHRGDIYIVLDSGEWRTLYPFMQMIRCSRCHTPEVYFIDRANRDFTSITLKSFERGHSEESGETAEAVAGWRPA